MNRVAKIVSCILVTLLLGLPAADYLGAFGYREKADFVLHEARLKPIDALTQAPIYGAHARCFQKGNGNACSQRDSGKGGIVSVMVPGTRISNKSLFFEHHARYLASEDPLIQIMLIHTNYINKVKSIKVESLFNNTGKVHKVVMVPRHDNNSADNNEEERGNE